MKKLLTLALALVLCLSSAVVLAELSPDFDPAQIMEWYDTDEALATWMTVNNNHWNADIATAPTDEELVQMLDFAMKSQTGIQWSETFFLVVRDPAAQQGIIGADYGTLDGCANEGTVTILVLVDNILPQEEHVSEYDSASFAPQLPMAHFNSGLTCGMFNVAATALGYSTHYFFYPSGELINGSALDASYFVNGNDYTRLWGMSGSYYDESLCKEYPVEGNAKMIAAIVVGTPKEGEDINTYATMYARPDNYAFWD